MCEAVLCCDVLWQLHALLHEATAQSFIIIIIIMLPIKP
jgi:hypothetical protein